MNVLWELEMKEGRPKKKGEKGREEGTKEEAPKAGVVSVSRGARRTIGYVGRQAGFVDDRESGKSLIMWTTTEGGGEWASGTGRVQKTHDQRRAANEISREEDCARAGSNWIRCDVSTGRASESLSAALPWTY